MSCMRKEESVNHLCCSLVVACWSHLCNIFGVAGSVYEDINIVLLEILSGTLKGKARSEECY